MSSEIKSMIVNGKNEDAIKHQAMKEGMTTLHKSTVDEVLSGVTTVEEMTRVIDVRTE